MSDILQKTDDAISLIETGLAEKSEVLAALAFKTQLWEAYRSLAFRLEQAAIAWIEANGEIESGETRYYIGKATKRTCKNVQDAFRAMLEECKGDIDLTLTALCSDPFKPAMSMKMLGAKAKEHFTEETVPDLKTGKAKKVLKHAQSGVDLAIPEDQIPF